MRNNKISILVKSRFNPELLYKVIVYWTGITWFHETQTFQFFFFTGYPSSTTTPYGTQEGTIQGATASTGPEFR